jgi:hypothetical protein
MFLVAFLLAIAMVMVVFLHCVPSCYPPRHCHVYGPPLVFLVAFSWPSLWSWSSSCVPSCAPPDHHCGHGHLLVLLVVFLLAIALVLIILLY